MSKIRSQMIRLAYENPELRADLLPLLKEAGGWSRNSHIRSRASNGKWIEITLQSRTWDNLDLKKVVSEWKAMQAAIKGKHAKAKVIQELGADDNEIVIFASWEHPLDDFGPGPYPSSGAEMADIEKWVRGLWK